MASFYLINYNREFTKRQSHWSHWSSLDLDVLAPSENFFLCVFISIKPFCHIFPVVKVTEMVGLLIIQNEICFGNTCHRCKYMLIYMTLIPYIPDNQKLLYSTVIWIVIELNKYHWLHVYSKLENIQTLKTRIKIYY